jgi:hypothetical protein
MDPAGNDENHVRAAAFKVRGKARHITGSLAPERPWFVGRYQCGLGVSCPVIRINLHNKFEVCQHLEIHDCWDERIMTSINSNVVLHHPFHLVYVGETRWNVDRLRLRYLWSHHGNLLLYLRILSLLKILMSLRRLLPYTEIE